MNHKNPVTFQSHLCPEKGRQFDSIVAGLALATRRSVKYPINKPDRSELCCFVLILFCSIVPCSFSAMHKSRLMQQCQYEKISLLSVYNSYSLEEQLTELQTGQDLAIIFKDGNFLQKYRDRKVFKEVLQIVGKTDLAVNVEKHIVAGKSY